MGDPLVGVEGVDFHFVQMAWGPIAMPGPALPKEKEFKDWYDAYEFATIRMGNYDHLSSDEKWNLGLYQNGEFRAGALALRTDQPLSTEYKQTDIDSPMVSQAEMLQQLDSVMAHPESVLPEGMMLYRFDHREFYEHLQEGDTFADKAFTSTKLHYADFEAQGRPDSSVVLEFHAPRGTRGIFMDTLSMRPAFNIETEILMDRNQAWRVGKKGTRKLNGRDVLYLSLYRAL